MHTTQKATGAAELSIYNAFISDGNAFISECTGNGHVPPGYPGRQMHRDPDWMRFVGERTN